MTKHKHNFRSYLLAKLSPRAMIALSIPPAHGLTPGEGEGGNILLAVLTAVGAAGIVIASLTSLITNRLSAQKHTEFNEELEQLRRVITKNVSCGKTIVPSTCSSSYDSSGVLTNADNLMLLDREGNPLRSERIQGHLAIGSWAIRARCVKSSSINTLQVSTARFNANGTAIVNSPLNKKPIGWKPLFESTDVYSTSFCQSDILGYESDDLAKHIKQEDLAKTNEVCMDMSDMTKQLEIPVVYKKTITCPVGSRVVAGGIECGTGPKNLLTGAKRGTVLQNQKTGERTWFASCCLAGILAGGSVKPYGYAVCSNY